MQVIRVQAASKQRILHALPSKWLCESWTRVRPGFLVFCCTVSLVLWNIYGTLHVERPGIQPLSTLQRLACGRTTRLRRVEETPPFNKSGGWIKELQEFGVTAPFKVFETTADAHALATNMQTHLGKYQQLMDPHIRFRGSDFLVIPHVVELAHSPQMVYIASTILGEDFMLSDAEVLANEPGRIFQFHRDTSFAGSGCGSDDGIAIWVALRSVTCASTLQVLPTTHRLNITAQEVLEMHGDHSPSKQDAHIANGKIVTNYATQHLQDNSVHVIAADVVDGEAIVFHPRTWHGSMNTANSTRFAVALRYMSNRCHPRLVIKTYPFASIPWLQPTILVRGNMAANNKQLVNLYEWKGSTTVKDGLTPFHLLTHQYSEVIANFAVKPFEPAVIRQSAKPVLPGHVVIIKKGKVVDKSVLCTERLGMFDISLARHPQFAEPPFALTRHVFSDVIILLSGEVKVTHVIHDGSYVRETIMTNPGAAVITDTMAWHKVTAISPNGSLCLSIRYIPRFQLEGAIQTNAADPSKLYDPRISEMTHDGIAFLHPKPGLIGVSPSVVVQSFVIAPGKSLPRNISVPADVILIVLSGSVGVMPFSCQLAAPQASLLGMHDVLFIPAACNATIHNPARKKALVEAVVFQGPAFGDPSEIQPRLRHERKKNDL